MTNEARSTSDEERPSMPFGLRVSSFLRHSSFGNSSFCWQISEDDRHQENVYERDFEKEDPAEPHQLVVTKAGERPADPDKKEEKRGDLREKDKDVKQPPTPARRAVGDAGEMP